MELCISNAYKGSLRSEMSFSSRKVSEGAKPLKEDSPVHQFPFSFLKTAGRLRVTDSVPWEFGEECELPIPVEGSGSSKGVIAGSPALFGINHRVFIRTVADRPSETTGGLSVSNHWRDLTCFPLFACIRDDISEMCYNGNSADQDKSSLRQVQPKSGKSKLVSRNAANGTFSMLS